MQYEPIKHSLSKIFTRSAFLRKLFYKLLDLLLLRTWYIHRELRIWSAGYKSSAGKNDNVNILDAGAGFGQYSYYLSNINTGWNILAVDINKKHVDDCNTFFSKIGRTTVSFETADLTTFQQQNSFELILSVDVMEHIQDDDMVFRNFHASLKDGALLLISTPSDKGGSDVHKEGDTSFIEEHVRNGYNIFDIKDKLKAAGFSKVEAHYSYGGPGKISWYLSMKYPILMLGTSKLFYILLPFYYLIAYPIAFALNHLDISIKLNRGMGLIVKAWK